MEFGPVPVARATGAVLAHSQPLSEGRIRKGRVLDAEDVERLTREGIDTVVVARLAEEDMGEDAAAERLAQALAPDPDASGLRVTPASTGRVNLHATGPGVLGLDVSAIEALNRLDPAITLSTLPPLARVADGTMVATIKIISYGVPAACVEEGASLLAGALEVHPVTVRSADLVITEIAGFKGASKGEKALAMRLERLGIAAGKTRFVSHTNDAIARALEQSTADLVLLLTASATSDARDVGPMGLVAAGGTLTRFGMPVDPGNLLFLGDLHGRPVIGLPGCARSPALNGADWVLERVVCGLAPGDDEIAAMGVGGLLKETPSRPHPRERSAGVSR